MLKIKLPSFGLGKSGNYLGAILFVLGVIAKTARPESAPIVGIVLEYLSHHVDGLPELLQKDKKYTASNKLVFPIPFCPKKQFSLAENPSSTSSRFL